MRGKTRVLQARKKVRQRGYMQLYELIFLRFEASLNLQGNKYMMSFMIKMPKIDVKAKILLPFIEKSASVDENIIDKHIKI